MYASCIMESRAVTLRDSDYCASQDDGERVQSCVATASQTATCDEQRNRLVKRSLGGKEVSLAYLQSFSTCNCEKRSWNWPPLCFLQGIGTRTYVAFQKNSGVDVRTTLRQRRHLAKSQKRFGERGNSPPDSPRRRKTSPCAQPPL